MGAAYKVSDKVTLNGNIANLFDKDFAKYVAYQDSNNNPAWASQYFQGGRSVTGGVIPGRTFWLSVNINF